MMLAKFFGYALSLSKKITSKNQFASAKFFCYTDTLSFCSMCTLILIRNVL